MGKKSRSGSGIRIRDEYFGSYFREFRNNFWVKILKFFDSEADPGYGNFFDPGSRIPDRKKFGSGINIPDPQHWLCANFFLSKETRQDFYIYYFNVSPTVVQCFHFISGCAQCRLPGVSKCLILYTNNNSKQYSELKSFAIYGSFRYAI
jgi:hypothetical protein